MKKNKLAVLVTTQDRGVFFGYQDKIEGDTIYLSNARNCIYWDSSVGGFIGLAEYGPNSKCRIGARGTGEIRRITSIFYVSDEAIENWEKAPVHKG